VEPGYPRHVSNTFAMSFVVAVALMVVLFVVLSFRRRRGRELLPESRFVVTANTDSVRVVDPSGQERRVSWTFVERVLIRTTDAGPLLPDVFWEVQPIEEPPERSHRSAALPPHPFLIVFRAFTADAAGTPVLPPGQNVIV